MNGLAARLDWLGRLTDFMNAPINHSSLTTSSSTKWTHKTRIYQITGI